MSGTGSGRGASVVVVGAVWRIGQGPAPDATGRLLELLASQLPGQPAAEDSSGVSLVLLHSHSFLVRNGPRGPRSHPKRCRERSQARRANRATPAQASPSPPLVVEAMYNQAVRETILRRNARWLLPRQPRSCTTVSPPQARRIRPASASWTTCSFSPTRAGRRRARRTATTTSSSVPASVRSPSPSGR